MSTKIKGLNPAAEPAKAVEQSQAAQAEAKKAGKEPREKLDLGPPKHFTDKGRMLHVVA